MLTKTLSLEEAVELYHSQFSGGTSHLDEGTPNEEARSHVYTANSPDASLEYGYVPGLGADDKREDFEEEGMPNSLHTLIEETAFGQISDAVNGGDYAWNNES